MPASALPTCAPPPPQTSYDVIVIGGGVVGACAAWRLASRSASVLLLEQHDTLHRKGSSHGESRIVRPTYPEEHYTRMMKTSYELWGQAQTEAGTSVFRRTGGLDMGPRGSKDMDAIISSAKAVGVDVDVYHDAKALARRCPGVVLPNEYVAVVNGDAGYVHATKAVAMFHTLAGSKGAVIRDRCRVERVAPVAAPTSGVEVVYSFVDSEAAGPLTNVVRARCVCVCAGAWSGEMLRDVDEGGLLETARWAKAGRNTERVDKLASLPLPLTPIHTSVTYWQLRDNTPRELYSSGSLPVFICYDTKYSNERTPQCYGIYGFPCSEVDMPGCVKACLHSGPPITPAGGMSLNSHLNARRDPIAHEPSVRQVQPFLRSVMPGLNADAPVHSEGCIYTMTPDHDFIVDTLLEERADAASPPSTLVAVAAGFSGHGFKLAPYVGERLADLCMGGDAAAKAREELNVLRMDRFAKARL
ncbi:sarcosine oxidase [Pseudoscourfieldia marina]